MVGLVTHRGERAFITFPHIANARSCAKSASLASRGPRPEKGALYAPSKCVKLRWELFLDGPTTFVRNAPFRTPSNGDRRNSREKHAFRTFQMCEAVRKLSSGRLGVSAKNLALSSHYRKFQMCEDVTKCVLGELVTAPENAHCAHFRTLQMREVARKVSVRRVGHPPHSKCAHWCEMRFFGCPPMEGQGPFPGKERFSRISAHPECVKLCEKASSWAPPVGRSGNLRAKQRFSHICAIPNV